MVKVFIERFNETKDVEASNIKDLFNKLNINPETIIVVRNNEIILNDSKLNKRDEVKLLSVISGG